VEDWIFPALAMLFGGVVLAALRRSRRRVPPPAPLIAEPEPVAPPPPPPPPETLPAKLQRLSDVLNPLAEKSAHPREMVDWPEFTAAVAAFAAPEVPLATLRQYACGANWPMACAAFVALAGHAERGQLTGAILSQLGNLRPWVLCFALRYLASLETRPAVGAPIAIAQHWWADNLIIPDLFREYLALREKRGDPAEFGEWLEARERSAPQHITDLLAKIDHPFAPRLLAQLRHWQEHRIDRQFLTSFGRIWSEDEEEPLLVEAEGWKEALDHAESAVRHSPPRSVLVTGEPRIGKSAFLKLLAIRLRRAGWSVFEAGGAELMADQIYIGQLEGRIRQLVAELDVRKRVAWCVQDLVQIAESGTHKGQTASILDQILPAVASGRLVILGEANPTGASRLLQHRPSLRSLIEICRLFPMTEAEAAALAGAVAPRLESALKLRIAPSAISAALQLAEQYLGSDQLPGVLIELVKRSAARAVAAHADELTAESVLATLSQLTGLPRAILDDKERIELKEVRAFFAARVIGQDEAVSAVVDRIAMLKAGLVDPDRPVGVFLFAGPTGTGKTELAKTLAEYLFGSPDRMARLDMSEFQTAEATSKILGLRGEAGQTDSLIERVRKQPFSVVLLDEFEKAHSNVWDLFLQIFDDGRLSDANGRVGDFRHTIIILTSNLGATLHRGGGLGFLPDAGVYGEEQVLRAVAQTFRPEFVNRLDKIIVFRPLSRELMRSILRKELAQLLERRGLRRREWAVEWEASAIEFLLDRGFSPEMGARPLKRAIDQHLLAPLAATLVERRFPEGDQFLFVRSNGRAIEVEFVDPDAEPPEAAPAAPTPEAESEGGEVSLAAMIARPAGTARERAALAAAAAGIEARLAGAEWGMLKDKLLAETVEPHFWSRPDRRRVLARLALMDRVGEAARTAGRLKLRLEAADKRRAAARDLVARLALHLHLVEEGIRDALLDAPVDVLVTAEPALDGAADPAAQAAWCERLLAMYRHWASRRGMQLDEHRPVAGRGPTILQIAGFGASRTLEGEAGLHILGGEESEGEAGRRIIARVRIAPAPVEEPKPSEAYREFARLLARTGEANPVVRRYRGEPAPLVRDLKRGWRSGRLEAVLAGDFDLMGAWQR
jgi:ATP-dependent Clp protease ATP-binding subunit ClpC